MVKTPKKVWLIWIMLSILSVAFGVIGSQFRLSETKPDWFLLGVIFVTVIPGLFGGFLMGRQYYYGRPLTPSDIEDECYDVFPLEQKNPQYFIIREGGKTNEEDRIIFDQQRCLFPELNRTGNLVEIRTTITKEIIQKAKII